MLHEYIKALCNHVLKSALSIKFGVIIIVIIFTLITRCLQLEHPSQTAPSPHSYSPLYSLNEGSNVHVKSNGIFFPRETVAGFCLRALCLSIITVNVSHLGFVSFNRILSLESNIRYD